MRRGVVFGVFDKFHPGHEWFLKNALGHCDHLTVVVASDASVEQRKARRPLHSLRERILRIQECIPSVTVVQGDAKEGEWTIFNGNDIDICILGYDQMELKFALEHLKSDHKKTFSIIQLGPYYPERFKSSLL